MDRRNIESDRTVSLARRQHLRVGRDIPDIEPRRLQPTRFQRPTTSRHHPWLDRDAEEDIAEGHDVDRQSMMSQCLDGKVDVRVLIAQLIMRHHAGFTRAISRSLRNAIKYSHEEKYMFQVHLYSSKVIIYRSTVSASVHLTTHESYCRSSLVSSPA